MWRTDVRVIWPMNGTSALNIIHVDMDAFFAAVEQRDNPALRGKPVVVGGPPHSRGVVSTCSYEARRYGVRSAMPSREAARLCPHAVFLPPAFEKYQRASHQIQDIFARFTSLLEPLSLDEAFLDVSGQDAVAVGKEIKAAIKAELDLTASVGVSHNKFLAKLASDWDKPDGFTVITPERAAEILPGLPVRKLWGIGPRSEEQLKALGIHTCADLLVADQNLLAQVFGRRAEELVMLAKGIDHRRVEAHREIKSMGEETTFGQDERDPARLKEVLRTYSEYLASRLRRHQFKARTVTIKLRFEDFQTITRSQTHQSPVDREDEIFRAACQLLDRVDLAGRRVRLIGLQVSGLLHPGEMYQMRLLV